MVMSIVNPFFYGLTGSNPAYVSQSITQYTSSTSTLSLLKPAGAQSGDILMALIFTTEATDTVTAPTSFLGVQDTATTGNRLYSFFKILASEVNTYCFYYSSTSHSDAIISGLLFRPANYSTPINCSVEQYNNTASQRYTNPGTTTDKATLLFAAGYDTNIPAVVIPAGWTTRINTGETGPGKKPWTFAMTLETAGGPTGTITVSGDQTTPTLTHLIAMTSQ